MSNTALQNAKADNHNLKVLLENAAEGIEWWIRECPEKASEADHEMLAEIRDALSIPTTPSHTIPQDHTGIREAGKEYREGRDAQLAPHTPGPGGRRVLPGSAT
jgi:hypothetical protein